MRGVENLQSGIFNHWHSWIHTLVVTHGYFKRWRISSWIGITFIWDKNPKEQKAVNEKCLPPTSNHQQPGQASRCKPLLLVKTLAVSSFYLLPQACGHVICVLNPLSPIHQGAACSVVTHNISRFLTYVHSTNITECILCADHWMPTEIGSATLALRAHTG